MTLSLAKVGFTGTTGVSRPEEESFTAEYSLLFPIGKITLQSAFKTSMQL